MLLRKNIRTPVRFEDEAVTFNIPKKKQLTLPGFPEMMAEQVTQFNKDATPAAFPSLPFNRAAPSLISANRPGDECDSDSDMGDIETADYHELACFGEEADITWSSLELAVQHRIWINLRRQHSQEHAATLLQLSEAELHDIRVAVEKRRQCPIDSSRVLATLDAVDDCHGTLLAQLTPYILTAQSYELAFPNDVELGRRYVRKLQLEGAGWYVGAWWPDPEGSGYLKCVPDTYNNASSGDAPTVGLQYPPIADEEHAVQTRAVAVSCAELNNDTLASNSNTRLSDSEYREAMQAKAAKLRLSRATGKTSSQTFPQKRPSETIDCPAVSEDLSQAVQEKPETAAPRRPIVIKAGRDPDEPASAVILAAPKTPTRDQPAPIRITVGRVDEMTPHVASHPTDSSSDAGTPGGARSSGSMSLRSRNSLRETAAMASMRQNNALLEGVLDDDATSESQDDSARQPHAPEKKVTLKINKKNALACIYRGERRIGTGYPGYQSILSPNKGSTPIDTSGSNGIIKDATGAVDDPKLFARHMDWSTLAIAERQRLLFTPIEQRNSVEMWLIYGTNTWKADSPWNVGRAAPAFAQPALGASLNPYQAGSVLSRFLVDEWNRYQSHGAGQELFEETAVGSIIIYFYAKMMEMKQMRQTLIRDEQDLEASGHVSHDQDRIDPHRRFHEEQQHWQRQLKLALSGEYAKRFQKIGKAMPSVDFSTPSIARVNPADHGQTPDMGRTLFSTSSALNKTPEQPNRTAPSNNFAMKLIETPSTGAGRAMTPPEDDLGIFGAKGVGVLRGTQVAESKMEHSEPPTPTKNDNSHLLPKQTDNNALNKHETGTQLVSHAYDQMGLITANQPAEAEDVLMTNTPPTGDANASVKTLTVASTPMKQKQSPRRPSWSPISDNDEFHTASSTPMLSHDQHTEASTPGVIYTPGRLTMLLNAAISEPTPPNSEVEDAADVGDAMKPQAKSDLMEAADLRGSFVPSIETTAPAQHHQQVGGPRTTPKLKLTMKQPGSLLPTTSDSPMDSNISTTKPMFEKTSTSASKDSNPVSEVSNMVTRSMTATPVPDDLPAPATGPPKKRKAPPKSGPKSKSSKKSKSTTPVHPQIEVIKREEVVNTPATTDNAKAGATPKASGPKKAKTKSTLAIPSTPRRPRGPYKKTRERMERFETEQEARKRAGVNVVADVDVEGVAHAVEMTG